jgi:CubicO group peptidase (beta-lactamase class C family)
MFEPNLDSNLNPANFDQNFNQEELFPNSTNCNGNSMMPTTSGTSSDDLIEISQANKTTYGLEGDDLLFGSQGKDVLFGNQGRDVIQGEEGDDLLNGGADIDYLTGNEGNDTLVGGADNDLLIGELGNDSLLGGSGNDFLKGEKGNDYLDGGAGLDKLYGDAGKDILVDEDGGDILTGGKGADEFRIGSPQASAFSQIEDFEVGTDKLKILRIGAKFDNLKIEDSEEGAMIFDGDKNIAILQGVKADDLQENDFVFADPKLAETLQAQIAQNIETTNQPGLSAAVIAPDGTSWLGTEGYANLETGQSLQPNDRFGIASVTKSFTATTVLQLAQENKLDLDDTLDKWLPDTASQIANGDRITVRQLLNHTSGIADYNFVNQFNALNDPEVRVKLIKDSEISDAARDVLVSLKDKPITPDFLQNEKSQPLVSDPLFFTKLDLNSPFTQKASTPEDSISKVYGQPASFEPGAEYNYSNTNYLLLGEIIEKATDSTVGEQFRERIFEPLGMKNTFYPAQEQVPGGYVKNYQDINGDNQPDDVSDKYDPSYVMPGATGGIVSTPADLSRFARGLFKNELLAPDTLKQMISGGKEGSDYGLGLEVINQPQLGQDLGHTGSAPGFNAKMSYFPDQDITVVTVGNGVATPPDPNSLQLEYSLAGKVK